MKTSLNIVIALTLTVVIALAFNVLNLSDPVSPLILIYIVSYIAVGGIAGMVNSPERQLRRRLVQQEKENYKHRGEVFYQGLHCPKCGNQLTGGGLSAKAGWGSDAGFDQEAMKQGVLKCSQCGQQLQL